MGTLTLVLCLAISVLLSAVVDRIIPRVSLPLIQVVMGALIAVGAGNVIDVKLDPELFLVLFIAPLLYIEAKDADKVVLWHNRGPIISLAIGLVVVSTLIIGFAVNALISAIPLAAAFALGAALGPTDAVAVTSLSKQVSIPQRQMGILNGELLLNDASGIVSFQFALAAVTTGVFSIWNASLTFVYEFIGGLLFGLAIGYVANFILRKIRDLGIENTTFHVLYEICIPFIVYLFASSIHVSGIIAVVVAGLVNVIAPRTVSPSIAHMNIVSSSVWQVMSFTLNGIVFVLLGTQIPTSMYYTWQNPEINNVTLILYILFVTAILLGVRFIWCLVMEASYERRESASCNWGVAARNAAITTLCGSKGTITLSILFTIPFYISTGQAFPSRNLIIFIGCGVILMTLLIANFCVPLVCPKKKRAKSEIEARQNYYETLGDILRNVITEITAQQKPSNLRATSQVIKAYQDRLEGIKSEIDEDDVSSVELRLQALEWERDYTLEQMESGGVAKDIGTKFLGRLERQETLIRHHNSRRWYERALSSVIAAFGRLRMTVYRIWMNHSKASVNGDKVDFGSFALNDAEEMRKLQFEAAKLVVERLHERVTCDELQTEVVSRLLISYEQRAARLSGSMPSVSSSFKIADESDDVSRLAYQIELEQIQSMYEQDRINRQEANRMRDNVLMMQMDLDDNL